jgi:hypothetical protein
MSARKILALRTVEDGASQTLDAAIEVCERLFPRSEGFYWSVSSSSIAQEEGGLGSYAGSVWNSDGIVGWPDDPTGRGPREMIGNTPAQALVSAMRRTAEECK